MSRHGAGPICANLALNRPQSPPLASPAEREREPGSCPVMAADRRAKRVRTAGVPANHDRARSEITADAVFRDRKRRENYQLEQFPLLVNQKSAADIVGWVNPGRAEREPGATQHSFGASWKLGRGYALTQPTWEAL